MNVQQFTPSRLLYATQQHNIKADYSHHVSEKCTCILLIIISCSTNGCVSPVRFMVPSSMMMAWTDGKDVWSGGSHCTDSIMGMLGREKEKSEDHCICSTSGSLFSMCIKVDLNIYPFTRDKLSSKLVLSVRFGTLLRPSVTFTISCSTLLQEPVNEEQEKCCKFKSFV